MKQIRIEITEEDLRLFQDILNDKEDSVVWNYVTEDGEETIEVVFESF